MSTQYAPVVYQQKPQAGSGKPEAGSGKREARSAKRGYVADKTEVLQGTLDLMVLKTLESMGSQHGYGIAQRLQQVSDDLLRLNQGTLYPALLRLEQRGWISSKWGTSDNNRKARFYTLTRAGRKQLQREADDWHRMAAVMARLLGGAPSTGDVS
jgi:PadR family transcriptional regulator PadR